MTEPLNLDEAHQTIEQALAVVRSGAFSGAEVARSPSLILAVGVASKLLEEVRRLREHSVQLNRVGFRMAEALGRVPDGAESVVGNVDEQLDALLAELEELRRAALLRADADAVRDDDLDDEAYWDARASQARGEAAVDG